LVATASSREAGAYAALNEWDGYPGREWLLAIGGSAVVPGALSDG